MGIDEQLPKMGEMFQQRYELLELLGRGGFAVVFRARDTAMSRDVAIKVLMPMGGQTTETVRRRFLREAAVFAGLEDPHTITMYDFGESPTGHLYMVFEYVRSEALSDVIRGGQPLHPRIVTHILIQLTSALREAHHKGVYHRDIKPANVLLYEYGDDPYRVKLIDFGIAKDTNPEVANLTKTGRIVGTPRYMAPEQLFGQSMGPDSDIYSLGLLAFEMIAGRPAVGASTNKEVLKQQVSPEDFVLPERIAPPGLRRVVQRMLRKERSARYQSAVKLMEELRRVMPEARAWIAEDALDTIVEEDGATLVDETQVQPPVELPPRTQVRQSTSDSGHPRPGKARFRWHVVWMTAGVILALGFVLILVREPEETFVPTGPTTFRDNVGGLVAGEAEEPPPDPLPTTIPIDVGSGEVTGCGSPQTPGIQLHRFDQDRRWHVHVPSGYDPDRPHPVILMFHRSWTGGKRMLVGTRMGKTADAQSVLVVSLGGTDSIPWQGPEDIGFAMQALRGVYEDYCVDLSRVYALGDGAGGGFVERLACSLPLSAIATTAHGMWEGDKVCEPLVPTPRMRIYGRLDKHVPLEGGTGCVPLTGPYVPATQIRERWGELYNCDEEPTPWGKYAGGKCLAWTCSLAPMLECETTGGHYWSTSAPLAIDLPGCGTDDPDPPFPYREAIWDFFEKEGRVLTETEIETQRGLIDL